jgi:hypothetical protein
LWLGRIYWEKSSKEQSSQSWEGSQERVLLIVFLTWIDVAKFLSTGLQFYIASRRYENADFPQICQTKALSNFESFDNLISENGISVNCFLIISEADHFLCVYGQFVLFCVYCLVMSFAHLKVHYLPFFILKSLYLLDE